VPGTLTIVKFEANNNYVQGPGQQIDFTICLINATGAPVAIQRITDTMPNAWQWASGCDVVTTNPNLACSPAPGLSGGTMSWGHIDNVSPIVMNPGERIDLRLHGSYTASGTQCNGPETAGIGYLVTLADTTTRTGNAACISVP
jgi:hypothetical protein